MKNLHFWHQIVVQIMLLVFVSITGTLIYGLFLDKSYLQYTILPIRVEESVIPQGGLIPLTISRCNSSGRPQTYTVSRSIENRVNGELTLMPDIGVQILEGCSESRSLVHRIPRDLRPGVYRLVGTSTVHGLIRTFEVHWSSTDFTVVPAVSQPE